MQFQVTAFDSKTRKQKQFTIAAADATQGLRFCRQYYKGLKGIKLDAVNEMAQVDHDFTEVQQFLSVRQYRKIRKGRDGVQFPILEVLLDQ